MLRRILYLTLGLVLALWAGVSMGQSPGYIPLQPAHTGNWYDPARIGEGVELTVFVADDGAPVVFGQVYLLTADGPRWFGLVERTQEAWDGARYEVRLYQRPEANGEPEVFGSAWFRPTYFGALAWTVLIGLPGDPILREGELSQLTRPVSDPIGRCGPWVFAPAPPPADPVFCHGGG